MKYLFLSIYLMFFFTGTPNEFPTRTVSLVIDQIECHDQKNREEDYIFMGLNLKMGNQLTNFQKENYKTIFMGKYKSGDKESSFPADGKGRNGRLIEGLILKDGETAFSKLIKEDNNDENNTITDLGDNLITGNSYLTFFIRAQNQDNFDISAGNNDDFGRLRFYIKNESGYIIAKFAFDDSDTDACIRSKWINGDCNGKGEIRLNQNGVVEEEIVFQGTGFDYFIKFKVIVE